MLVVSTTVKESEGRGLGLFTNENIKEGHIITVTNPFSVSTLSKNDYEKLNNIQKEFIKIYCIFDGEKYHLDNDNTRFINHADNPNISFEGDCGYATRDIFKGEELLCDYRKIGDIEYSNNIDFKIN